MIVSGLLAVGRQGLQYAAPAGRQIARYYQYHLIRKPDEIFHRHLEHQFCTSED